MVEERKIDPLFKQIMNNCITTFEESKAVLDSAFNLNSGDGGEVSCEVVKIPMTCTLTTERIKYPVRGSFCTHFQCFDLLNFMRMISSSANPKWSCPLCKMPCFQFRVDALLTALIQEYQKHGATEIMFFKNG